MPELTAIGVGPGNYELLTVKAYRAIKDADVIVCPSSGPDRPSIALSIVEPIIDRAKGQDIVKLTFPMTKDRDILEQTWKTNAELLAQQALTGKKIVYLTVGDPYLYSTWIYLHRRLGQDHPEIKVTVIPGIVSIFSFTSKIGISLGEGAEKITIVPSCYDLSQVKRLAETSDTMVFLKDGRYFDQVIELLREAYPPDSLFAIGQDLDTDKEIVQKMTLGQVSEDTLTTKYFSIMVVKRA